MSDRLAIDITFSSPKGPFTAEVLLERGRMQFGLSGYGGPAVCVWNEGRDPTWDHWQDPKNWKSDVADPVREMLEWISVYPPSIFSSALIYTWKAWRNHELTDEEVEEEIKELFKWVDDVYEHRPRTRFWLGKF